MVLHSRFGQAEVLDLPLLDQVLHRPRHVLDRHRGIDAMLVVEVDGFDAEPLQRPFGAAPDDLGPAVHELLPALDLDAELGGDDHSLADRSQRFTDELFVRERPVDLRGVEERDATVDGGPQQRDHLGLVRGRSVAMAHAHAAETDGRDFEAAATQLALLHSSSSVHDSNVGGGPLLE